MKNELKFVFRVLVITFAAIFFTNNCNIRVSHNFHSTKIIPIHLSVK
jgi:hypothetical protein